MSASPRLPPEIWEMIFEFKEGQEMIDARTRHGRKMAHVCNVLLRTTSRLKLDLHHRFTHQGAHRLKTAANEAKNMSRVTDAPNEDRYLARITAFRGIGYRNRRWSIDYQERAEHLAKIINTRNHALYFAYLAEKSLLEESYHAQK
jgi:hypothetical protein